MTLLCFIPFDRERSTAIGHILRNTAFQLDSRVPAPFAELIEKLSAGRSRPVEETPPLPEIQTVRD